jgi:hypothetical protein
MRTIAAACSLRISRAGTAMVAGTGMAVVVICAAPFEEDEAAS